MVKEVLMWYVAALIVAAMLSNAGFRRPLLIVILPLFFLDCLGNLMLLQSFNRTMSAEAWYHRNHKYWFWCHRAIDAVFFWDNNHCQMQAIYEQRNGGAWRNAWHLFKKG